MRLELFGIGHGLARVPLQGLCRGGWLVRTTHISKILMGGNLVIGFFEFTGGGGGRDAELVV